MSGGLSQPPGTPPDGAPRPTGRGWRPRLPWDDWVLVVISVLVLADTLRRLGRGFGWDTAIYCAAATAFQNGLDPYQVGNLGGVTLSFVYQPLYLYLIAPLCGVPTVVPVPFTIASVAAALAMVCLWPGVSRRRDRLLAVVLALGCASGFAWTLVTGNVSAFECLVLTLAVMALRVGRWGLGAAVLGLLGSLKLVPLMLLAVVLLADGSWKRRFRLVGVGVAAFAAVALASAALQPDYTLSFLRQITGGIPGQHSPVWETGDVYNPGMVFLLGALAGVRGHVADGTVGYSLVALALYGGVFLLVAGAAALVVKRRERGVPDPEVRIGFALLILVLFMPRLKPYAFMLAGLPVWLLARPLGAVGRVAVAVVAAGLPALWGLTAGFGIDKSSTGWNFQQPLALSAVLVLLLVLYSPAARPCRESPPQL